MDKLPQIQIGRAIAALMVVYYHSYIGLRAFNDTATVPLPFLTEWGFLGVNLFFIISGFIIGLVADQTSFSARDFLVKRFFRVFPVYWIFILAQVAFYVYSGNSGALSSMDGWTWLKNLLIFPIDGEPFFSVGWSLEHEVIFYLLALFLVPWTGVAGLFVVVAFLGVWGQSMSPPWGAHLFSAHQIEFAAGLAIYLTRKKLMLVGWQLPLLLSILGYVCTVWLVPYSGPFAGALFLIFLLNIPSTFCHGRLQPLVWIGDASYSLYLCHWLVLQVAAVSAWLLPLPPWMAEPYRAVFICASVYLAMLLHAYVERPLIRHAHRLTRPALTSPGSGRPTTGGSPE